MDSGFRALTDENFDYDPMTRTRQKLTIDNDGVMHFTNSQDDSEIRQYAHECRGVWSQHQKLGDIAPVATIPVVVQYDLLKRGIWQDKDRFRKWLNSIEAAPYRTREFTV